MFVGLTPLSGLRSQGYVKAQDRSTPAAEIATNAGGKTQGEAGYVQVRVSKPTCSCCQGQ